MGKAKRAKEKKLQEEQRRAAAEAKKHEEKKENLKIVTIVVAIILAVSIVVTSVCLIVIGVKSKGNYLRDKVSVSSENYEINNAMLSYLFADNFYTQKSYFDYYASYFKLDTSASLKSQSYSDTMTWYDYFLQAAANNASSILVNAEAAKVQGITIGDIEKALIDKEIDGLKDAASEKKLELDEYLSEYYGLGVKEQDVRDMLELYYLSLKYYYTTIYGIEVTDEEISKYYEDNKDDFLKVNYKTYTVKADYDSKATDDEKKKAYEEAKTQAEAIAAAKTSEEFDSLLMAYLKKYKADDKKFTETVEAALVEGELYNKDSEYSKWLFNDETKVGNTKVIDDGKGNYTVYMLVSAKAREEYATKDVRHILFIESEYESKEACLAAAEAALAEFNKTGKTQDDFAKLAEKYTGDTGSIYNGGLYESVSKGQMVEEFEDWAFDEKREVGDVEIVYTESYGYHVMYFCGDGEQAWSAVARDAVKEDKYEKISEEIVEKYKITVDLKKASNVPDINK